MIDIFIIFLLISLPCGGFVAGCYYTKYKQAKAAEQAFDAEDGFIVFVPTSKDDDTQLH